MQTMLMNFGDNSRIVYNTNMKAITIGIGLARKVDLDDATLKFIKRSQGTDTLLVVPMDEKMPSELSEVLQILESISTVEYSDLIVRVTALIGAENMPGLNPTRHALRVFLRNIAVDFVNDRATTLAEAVELQKPKKTPIKDDEDPKTLEKEQRDQESKQLPPTDSRPPMVPLKDSMDAALGISTQGSAGAGETEGGDLPPDAEETDADPSETDLTAQETAALAAARAAMTAEPPPPVRNQVKNKHQRRR